MKTLIISLILILFAGLSQAQVIELSEAKIGFEPVALEKENSFRLNVKENYVGEFEKNPLVFMENNFDIKTFINRVKNDKYNSYRVSFRSKKGFLNVEFDEEGNLLKTSQKFTNVRLPGKIYEQLYRDFKGWVLAKTVHVASGKPGKPDRDVYHITLKKGNKKESLKIKANPTAAYTVAQN